MDSLPRLHTRISNLLDLRDIIKALRALAASTVQEAQAALPGIRSYVQVVEDAIAAGAVLAEAASAPGRDAGPSRPPASALVLVCSEHGFVGGFNEHLLDFSRNVSDAGRKLIVAGNRGVSLAAERGLDVEHSFAMATHVSGVLGLTRRIADRLAPYGIVDIVFAAYRRGGYYEPQSKRLLPLDPALLKGAAGRSPPVHYMAPEVLLQRLAGEYLFGEITRAVMESLASENGARLRAMETADHNMGDKLDDLRGVERTLRQEVITSELLDVITGSEAILSQDS